MTNNRPQGQFTHFAKISNGHNSATCQPIPIMFGSMWGFRGRRIKWRHFWLDQIQDGSRRPLWKTSNGHISVMHCPIDFVFGSRVGFSPRTDRTALLQVCWNPRCSPFWKFQRTISLKCIIRFTDPCISTITQLKVKGPDTEYHVCPTKEATLISDITSPFFTARQHSLLCRVL